MGLKKYLVSQIINDPVLGRVKLRVLSTAVRYSARWKVDGLHITIPARTTFKDYEHIMKEWRSELLKLKPEKNEPKYYDGFSFSAHDWQFTIRSVEGWRRHSVGWELVDDKPIMSYIIKVSPLDDLGSPAMERTVAKAIMHVAALVAPRLILPLAKSEAKRLGLERRVHSWSIGRGQRRLGCCKASGDISLSAILMFFPDDVRRATITHELAHLNHFDHSPAFHALWERYLGCSPRLHRPNLSQAPV